MAKPTEEQIRDLKKLLADIEDARQEAENLANTSKETLEAATGNLGQQYTDLVDEIKEALKQQYEFLSSQELSAEIQLKLIHPLKVQSCIFSVLFYRLHPIARFCANMQLIKIQTSSVIPETNKSRETK